MSTPLPVRARLFLLARIISPGPPCMAPAELSSPAPSLSHCWHALSRKLTSTRLARHHARFVDFEKEGRSDNCDRSLTIRSGDSSIREDTTRRTHSSLLHSLRCAICLSDEYPSPSSMSQRSRWQSRSSLSLSLSLSRSLSAVTLLPRWGRLVCEGTHRTDNSEYHAVLSLE